MISVLLGYPRIFSISPLCLPLIFSISTDEKEETRKTFVRGLTSYELTKLLEERYSNYFINAEVFIDIVTFKPLRISISGELRNPGIYNFPAYQRGNFLYSQNGLISRNFIQNNASAVFISLQAFLCYASFRFLFSKKIALKNIGLKAIMVSQ